MFQKHRLFISLDLPDEISREVLRIQADLRHVLDESLLTWSRVHGLHLTLKFLGIAQEESIGIIQKGIIQVTEQQNPIQIALRKLGIFPSIKCPRVLWCGISSKSDDLLNFQSMLDDEFEKIGFTKEGKPFVPHLTIGRFRGLVNKNKHFFNTFQGVLEKESTSYRRFVSARFVSLIKSQLHHTGSIYTSLFTVRF